MARIGCCEIRRADLAARAGDRRGRDVCGGRRLLAIGSGAVARPRAAAAAAADAGGAVSFAGAALALGLGEPRMAAKPLLAAAVLAGVTTVDLAYNNGPSSSTAQPPAMYEVLEPDTRNATIAILKSKVVADATRRDRIELAGLGFHWPNASLTHRLENTLGYNPVRLALYSAGDRRRGPRRPAGPAPVLAAVSLLSLDAGQPAGPALHRHRRADRDRSTRA